MKEQRGGIRNLESLFLLAETEFLGQDSVHESVAYCRGQRLMLPLRRLHLEGVDVAVLLYLPFIHILPGVSLQVIPHGDALEGTDLLPGDLIIPLLHEVFNAVNPLLELRASHL